MRPLEVGLLCPRVPRAREHVDGSGLLLCVVHPIFGDGADRERLPVAAQSDRIAELVALSRILTLARLAGVRRLDVRLLRPGGAGAGEDVDGTGLRDGVVVLVAVDTGGGARFPMG